MRNNGPSSLLPLLFQVIDARIDLRTRPFGSHTRSTARTATSMAAAAPATVARRQCNVLLHFQSQ
jgi:hypothetical protein